MQVHITQVYYMHTYFTAQLFKIFMCTQITNVQMKCIQFRSILSATTDVKYHVKTELIKQSVNQILTTHIFNRLPI